MEDPRAQAEKFTDLARELGCDDDQNRFDERLRRVVKATGVWTLWKLDWGKVDGFTAHAYSGQPPRAFPMWATLDEGRAWMKAHGYQMVDDDPDMWTAV